MGVAAATRFYPVPARYQEQELAFLMLGIPKLSERQLPFPTSPARLLTVADESRRIGRSYPT